MRSKSGASEGILADLEQSGCLTASFVSRACFVSRASGSAMAALHYLETGTWCLDYDRKDKESLPKSLCLDDRVLTH